MKLRNYWLNKKNEKLLLKVVEWAHRRSLKLEKLSEEEIYEAAKSFLRDPSHS